MGNYLKILLCGLFAALFAADAGGGVVRLRDGRELKGKIQLEPGKVVLTPGGAAPIALDGGQVIGIDMADDAVASAPAAAAPRAARDVVEGLTGEYFNNPDLTDIREARIDEQINFDWGVSKARPSIRQENISIRWSGKLIPPATGSYTFYGTSDDGLRLWINNQPVLDNWLPGNPRTVEKKMELTANQPVDIRFEYLQVNSRAMARLEWAGPNIARQLIPASALRPDMARLKQFYSNGLLGEYYSDLEFKNLVFARLDPWLNFQWDGSNRTPGSGMPAENFVVRWTGFLQAKYTEKYTFTFHADDGLRVWLDNKLILDQWEHHADQYTATAEMTGGRRVEMRVELRQKSGDAKMVAEWTSAHQPKQIIPREQWTPPPTGRGVPPLLTWLAPSPEAPVVSDQGTTLQCQLQALTGQVRKVEYLVDKQVIGSATAPPYSVKWNNPPVGRLRVMIAVSGEEMPKTLLEGPILDVRPTPPMPPPWGDRAVGNVGKMGRSSYDAAAGKLTIVANGQTIYNDPEAFHFVAQSLRGSGQLVARMVNLQGGNSGAIAGVMIRENMGEQCRYVFSGYNPVNGRISILRPDSVRRFTDQPMELPIWIKVSRTGNSFVTSFSKDGKQWSDTGATNIDLGEMQIGLVAASGDPNQSCTAVFDNVHLQATTGTAAARGVMLTDGSILAGDILSMSLQTVKVRHDGVELPVAASRVARIFYAPSSGGPSGRLAAGTSGGYLASGDFYQGEITALSDDKVTISSVLFGPRQFTIQPELSAMVLRDASAPAAPAATLMLRDGSLLYATDLSFANGQVRISQPILGSMNIPLAQLKQISRP